MTDKDAPAGPVNVAQAMRQVMELVTVVRKDQVNTTPGQGGYKFRGIDAVVNAIGPAMRQVGLVVVPGELLDVQQKEIVVGQKQSRMIHSVVRVRYRVLGPGGDELSGESIGEAFDSGDKSMAKAMSVSLRTFLLQAFMLPTDDPDPDETSYDLGAAARQDLPPSRAADRSRSKAQRNEDPWTVHPLTAGGKQQLRDLLVTDDPDRVRSLWREIREAQTPQTVTLKDLGRQHAAALGVEGDVDLLALATRVGEHLAANGISVAEHVAADAAPAPTPMGSGDAEAARDAADIERGADPYAELRKGARGRNGGQQG